MLTHAVLFLALTGAAFSDDARKHKHADPFAALDTQITHSLAYHYLWPWSQLIRAAAALDSQDTDPQINSDRNKFEISMNVRRFKPDELKVKVKNRYVIVEGKHRETNQESHMFANHFVQKFVIPADSKPEEVKAVLQEDGVLSISAPKHELPPPPPEREIPIEVKLRATTAAPVTTTTVKQEVSTEKVTPLEHIDLVEATTYAGKIRKKELKTTTKTVKDNEVSKGDSNGLDYALEAE